jgi:membrane protease YdiL (CAAX protease family)
MGLQLLMAGTMLLRPSAAHDIVHIGGVSALVFVLGVMGIVALHGRDVPLRDSLGVRPAHPAFLGLAVALGFSLHWPAGAVESLAQRLIPTPRETIEARISLLSAASPLQLSLLLLVVACVGPLVEELFFRGALYGALRRRYSLAGAGVATAVCFVVGHLDVYAWLPLAAVSAAMTHLRAMSGSLLPPLCTHVAFNAVTVLGVFTGPPPVAEVTPIEVAPALGGTGVTLLLVAAVHYVGRRAPEARRGRAEDAA